MHASPILALAFLAPQLVTEPALQASVDLSDPEPHALDDLPAAPSLVFDGTGGPGGDFDLVVPAGTTFLFNTVSTVVTGGPGGVSSAQQVSVGGRLDVRDLIIEPGATFRIEGPNRARILATGNVVVEGQLLAEGGDHEGIYNLLLAALPDVGAPGAAGGGRGGTGSFLTTQSTPFGGPGFGAFNGPRRGGRGGESAFKPAQAGGFARRAGGGGGGTFGADVRSPNTVSQCLDNNVVGLDAEPGFDGSPTAFSALDPQRPPRGGRPAQRPFRDGQADNDFYGTLSRADGTLVRGELTLPWAGAGGGAGGDAIPNGQFPNPGFASQDNRGSGGGGGGGSLHIQALGDVVVGELGLISVRGGHGGGGENTNGVDRIGGGSGGGSGGHLIIETLSTIDLSAVRGSFPSSSELNVHDVGLIATGGQGGAGANNIGGAGSASAPEFPCRDAHPLQDGCWIGVGPVVGAGGDGGPGLIQLHVLSLDGPGGQGDILPPADGRLFDIGVRGTCTALNRNVIKNTGVIKPPPIGARSDVQFAGDTLGWDRLLPAFGSSPLHLESNWLALAPTAHGRPDLSGLPLLAAKVRRSDGASQGEGTPPQGERRTVVQYQATRSTLSGAPDETRAVRSRWVTDASQLEDGTAWRYLRVRVLSFDGGE